MTTPGGKPCRPIQFKPAIGAAVLLVASVTPSRVIDGAKRRIGDGHSKPTSTRRGSAIKVRVDAGKAS
jgi:hypothetical protein